MLSVVNKPYMLSVVMQSVIMLIVMAPYKRVPLQLSLLHCTKNEGVIFTNLLMIILRQFLNR
jgi:hypothetical protein